MDPFDNPLLPARLRRIADDLEMAAKRGDVAETDRANSFDVANELRRLASSLDGLSAPSVRQDGGT
ncbi:MAG: hypothetical protein RID91_03605 [Azospirillaceae bacterium]